MKNKTIKCLSSLAATAAVVAPVVLTTSCTNIAPIQFERGFIAHRGLCSQAFQNSEQAFILAGEDSTIGGIETDIYMTLDGVLVCSHDDNAFDKLDQTGDITPLITQSNWNGAGGISETVPDIAWKRNGIEPTTPLATFDRYLEICRENYKAPVVELKQQVTIDLADQFVNEIMRLLQKHNLVDDTIFISFNHSGNGGVDLLAKLKNEHGQKKLQRLFPWTSTTPVTKDDLIKCVDDGYSIDINYENVIGNNRIINNIVGLDNTYTNDSKKSDWQEVVEYAHKKDLKVNVWTVNNWSDMLTMLNKGVDYITSDFAPVEDSFFVA